MDEEESEIAELKTDYDKNSCSIDVNDGHGMDFGDALGGDSVADTGE